MSNIFQERDESKLIKDRKVRPVKGNSVQQPTPPQPEPAVPQPQAPAQEPQQQPQAAPQQPQAEVAPQPEAPKPVDYSQYYSAPIPFMPPVGYAGVQSNPNAFQAQYQLLDALQTPEVQQGRLDPIIPLLQQNVVTNPGVTSLADVSDDLNEKAERWTNDWTSSVNKSYQSYKNYVTHNKVGVNPATQFNASGKPIRRATETEIRTGLNGLMSELGTSLRNNFDKDNWFTGSIQTMKGLVPMVGNVLKSIPGVGGFVQVADILTEKFLGEDAVKNSDPMIGDAKRAMYQLAHGNVGEANKILQNSPVQTNWDYGKGLTGLAFYALSLPENLVAAGVYEYADGWRQFMDNREKRGFTQNFTAGLQAAAGTIQMFEPELDKTRNRFGQVLRGKSLGTFQRWTEDKYLAMQEPAGVEMGTIINNPYFDLPENLIKAYNLLPTPDIDTTKGAGFWTQAMLHNVTQGIPAFMIEMLADAPADFLVGSLWKAGKALDGIDLLPNRVSGLIEAGEDVPFIQTRPVGQLALPGTVEVPGVDEYRASIMTVDVEARTVGDYPMVANPWDVSPNPNKAQTTIINLDNDVPRTVPSVDLDYVRRSNEDLARLANRMGILVEPTPEGIDALMRQDPQQFARYGKPVHPEIENFNGVQVNGEVVPVANVYPISLTPPDAPPSLEDLTAAGNLMSDAAEDIKDALRTGNDPSSALVLYKKAESDFVVARDGLPPDVAYKENVHNLPSELVTQKPEALSAGINYVSNLVEAEQTNRVVKQLVNEYEQLDGVEQLIDTKLKALPDVGYEDMHDVQAVMGQNGMDDMMNNPIAKDVPEPQELIEKFDPATDQVMLGYEKELHEKADSFRAKYDAVQKRLVKEYKKQGLDPLDVVDDPELATIQANHLFNVDTLRYKQSKRIQEVTGKVSDDDLATFIEPVKLSIKEYGKYLPQSQQQSWQMMLDDMAGIKGSKEKLPKYSPVPQQQVIEQQIQTTDKAGDLQMSGKRKPLPLEQGNVLTEAWQAGVDWFKDAFTAEVKLEVGGTPTTWLHGTNVNDDVRRFMPENGSGTHELGIGLYLTDSEQVAEAAAKKFRYENTPINMNYEVGDATIRELSDVNIQNTLDLNQKIGKKQFMRMFEDPLPHNPADVQDFYKYWKSNTDNSIGSVFDSYREWYSGRGGIDELAVRQFQVDVFNKFRLEYDAGVHTAPNGVRTMVVYNPDKLTNSGVRFVDKAEGVDETLEALEARRFLDHQAEVAMGSDTRKVVRLQSESDLTAYQKQKASEALAEELVNQAEATKNITEADEVLRETVRKAEDEKINKVEEAVEKGHADSVPVEAPTKSVDDVLKERNSYHKFRDKLGQKLDKKIKRLAKMTGSTKAKRQLAEEVQKLTEELDNVDTYVKHQQRIFEAIQHEPVRGDWKDLLSTVLHQVDGHIIDPDWWKHRGNYKWDKAFQQASEGFNSIIAKFVSNYLGGDIGKVQRELHNLKRVGQGDFALRLAQREASQRVSRVQKEVKQMLKQFNLSDHDFGRLFHDVAELQTSKYIMDEAFADSKVAHYLSNKLNTQFSYFINEMGIPLDVMEDVALKVQEIPQVYKEVKQLADELGINFGDEVSLGYIPRQTKRTMDFWMNKGFKGEATGADFVKSRQAFHWIPEDSKVVESVLDVANKKWKEQMSEVLGKEVTSFDDLLDSDATILHAVVGYLNDDMLDFLNDTGIMRKIPFTATESAEFLAKKYDLPFKGVADVYVTDPKRAMEMYTKGLADKAGKNMTAFGFTEMPAFTKNIEDMTDAEKEVFTVPFMEALPDALKGSLPDDFTKLVEPLYVHPLVARELEAMYHTSTSAGILAQIGDTLSLIYKYQSSQMLASGGWLAYQEIGNSMNLVKRNINPASFFDFQAKRVHAAATGKQIMDLMDDTKKVYGKGAFTQKEVAQQALRFGLIDSDATFLGSSSPRPSVFNYSDPSTWGNAPKEIQRSLTEFIAFTFRLKGHQEFQTAGGYFGGLVQRLQSGVDTVIDHTTMKYVDTFNKLTDDGYKFALFEAVLRDNSLPIPGIRFASGIPHFTGKNAFRQAAEYVRDNAFMFDETSGAAGEQAMRYVIPFWSFHRLNIGETARWIASNPFKFGNWLRLANSLQADFEEGDSAQWESLQSNKWFDNNFTIPIRIKADRSQSGTDEIWTLPGAQIFPSAGALQATDTIRELVSNIPGVNIPKFKFDYGEGELRPSQSEVNPMSKGSATFVQREGSPFLKTLLGFLDENYLFDYDLSAGYEMDKDYALGMDKKQYALFKLWLRPMANLLNAMPTQLMGRAPSLNRATGEYKEGERSVFTGQYPHWTSANTPNFFGEGVFSDFLKNMKLQPMPFDTYINQEYTIGNITNQVYQAKDMMEKVRKELATTKPDDTAKIERLQQRAQETTLLYVHLQSEYEIYRQWRKLNNIPHPKAVKRIMQENLKVSDLLPEQDRQRIYQENWDKYMNYFTY